MISDPNLDSDEAFQGTPLEHLSSENKWDWSDAYKRWSDWSTEVQDDEVEHHSCFGGLSEGPL